MCSQKLRRFRYQDATCNVYPAKSSWALSLVKTNLNSFDFAIHKICVLFRTCRLIIIIKRELFFYHRRITLSALLAHTCTSRFHVLTFRYQWNIKESIFFGFEYRKKDACFRLILYDDKKGMFHLYRKSWNPLITKPT